MYCSLLLGCKSFIAKIYQLDEAFIVVAKNCFEFSCLMRNQFSARNLFDLHLDSVY
jgi:hypothetical protein